MFRVININSVLWEYYIIILIKYVMKYCIARCNLRYAPLPAGESFIPIRCTYDVASDVWFFFVLVFVVSTKYCHSKYIWCWIIYVEAHIIILGGSDSRFKRKWWIHTLIFKTHRKFLPDTQAKYFSNIFRF